MSEKGQEGSFLFAVADIEEGGQEGRVHGFVYVYPRKSEKNTLEVSYARRPDSVPGLTADGLHLSLEIVRACLSQSRPWIVPQLRFVAEIEKGNYPSIKVVERAGFVQRTGYDRSNNALWMLSGGGRKPKDQTSLLGRVRQTNGSYCGPATIQILASHFGIPLDQEEVVDAAEVRDRIALRGMSVEQMAKAARKLLPDYTFWVKTEASLGDIEKMVRVYNYPVGVNWQGIFETTDYEDDLSEAQKEQYIDEPMCKGEQGHYSVVVDLERAENFIRITDPYGHYSIKDRYLRLDEFENRWWDDRMDYFEDGSKKYFYANRLMYAITPKGVRLPEEIGMREI